MKSLLQNPLFHWTFSIILMSLSGMNIAIFLRSGSMFNLVSGIIAGITGFFALIQKWKLQDKLRELETKHE